MENLSLFGDYDANNKPVRRCRDCAYIVIDGTVTLCGHAYVHFPDGKYKKIAKTDKACNKYDTRG